MREMKDSGIEWIGEIPEAWNTRKIKYIATLAGRIGWQGLTSEEYSDEGAYLITGVNFKNGIIDWGSCVHVPMSRWEEATQIQIKEGDLLITKDGTVGKVAIAKDVPAETSLNSGVLLIRNSEKCDTRFLYWMIQSEVFWKWFSLINAGNSTIIHLYQQDFYDFSFPFPSIKDQITIANYLDSKCAKIDSIIEKQQAIIEKLKEYKLSVITEAVTKGLNPDVEMKDSGIKWIGDMPSHWQRGRLSDVTDRIIVGLATSVTPYYRPSGMVLLRNLNIKEGYLDDTELLYLDEEFANSQIGKYIEKDDVLTVHTGSNLGLTCVVPDKYEHTLSFTTLITTPTKEKLDSFYLMYTINSGLGKSEIDKLKCGDIKPNLNVGQFKYFTVFVPPIDEQKEIVSFLDKRSQEIDNDILVKEQVIKKLNEYKKSLIYEVVTGKKEV